MASSSWLGNQNCCFQSSTIPVSFWANVSISESACSISCLVCADSCIYFELKQFKVKEKKWSTMGWTYRHKINFVKVVDGVKCIRTEAQGLNLYEKPIDLRSHFKQSAMKKMRPLSTTSPDFYLRVAEAP